MGINVKLDNIGNYMSKILTIKFDRAKYDDMFAIITSDLKGYRVNYLKKIAEVNCRMVTEYLDSKLNSKRTVSSLTFKF